MSIYKFTGSIFMYDHVTEDKSRFIVNYPDGEYNVFEQLNDALNSIKASNESETINGVRIRIAIARTYEDRISKYLTENGFSREGVNCTEVEYVWDHQDSIKNVNEALYKLSDLETCDHEALKGLAKAAFSKLVKSISNEQEDDGNPIITFSVFDGFNILSIYVDTYRYVSNSVESQVEHDVLPCKNRS